MSVQAHRQPQVDIPVPQVAQQAQPSRHSGGRGNSFRQNQLAEQTTHREPSRREAPKLAHDAFANTGLRPGVFRLAQTAFQTAWAKGDTHRVQLTIIDFELPSSQKRLWVIDMQRGRLLFHELVAHGQNSGGNRPNRFSNRDGSHQSNIGVLKTAETYHSRKHGLAMRIDGLEDGVNDHARRRAIVMHGADYVSEDFVQRHGRLGRSWGCPALSREVNGDVIDTIKGGSLMVMYYPDQEWLDESEYLNPQGQV